MLQKLKRYFCGDWRLAVLDLEKGRWIVEPSPSNIGYLKAENANGRHILMQPAQASPYLLVDDLPPALIIAHHQCPHGAWKPGRMVVETSPGNYQVWIHSHRSLSLMEKRYWLKRLRSDPASDPDNRWGRCPGFRNRKDKYRNAQGQYPLARLIWVDWATLAQIPEIPFQKENTKSVLSHQPTVGGVCLQNKQITRCDFERGNDSQTDFSYALALARRNHTKDQIRFRILSERPCWKNHRGEKKLNQYLDRTIAKAMEIVAKA